MKIFSQQKYIVKYENGKTKIEGFIKNNVLDSIYKEYYESGVLKIEGFYKDCNYKTNHAGIYILGCGVGKENDSIKSGTKHGVWKNYFESGVLSYTSNFHCGVIQGNNFSYNKTGRLQTTEFYSEGKLIYSQDYNENGIIIENSNYKYKFHKTENFKNIHTFKFYENGDLKIENIINENNKTEDEFYKEYYPNGFLKLEKHTINGNKFGIYREYYENGNIKYESVFKNNIPVKKQYFNNEDGTVLKIETWKKGKL